jgi:EAL and modified HD-GYP domain-containing signal transduction protein
MRDIFVGRQPIYRRNLELYAYELLFRGNNMNTADVKDGDKATSEVLYNTFVDIGLDQIVGKHRAFVNLTPRFIIGEYPLPDNSSKQMVLEVLEDVQPSPVIIDGLKDLVKRGYVIALDDFVYRPELKPLIELATIIKVDITQLSSAELADHVDILREYDVKLLAEKVETQDEFEFCKDLGFNFFQGYFFAKPNIVKGKQLPANKLSLLQLIAELNKGNASMQQMNEVISTDVTLVYRLLRMINSAAMGVEKHIDSVKEAIMLLGVESVKNWACMLTLSQVDDKPHELLVTALVRARMAEQLARRLGVDKTESYFTAGMFSVLDAMMDQPLPALIQKLPLSDEVKNALMRGEGQIGTVIKCVLSYEKGRWDWVKRYAPNLDTDDILDSYINAVNIAREIAPKMAA